MSEGLNELESALRQLQPAPVVQGPILIEMGRAAGAHSARRWKWATLLTSLSTAALAGILLALPAPATSVRIVYLSIVNPREEAADGSNEAIGAAEAFEPPSGWPKRVLEARQKLEPVSTEVNEDASLEPAPLRAGDLVRDPSLVSSFTKWGGR